MRHLPRREPREEELAALADGSLAPDRRAAVEAMVERSPELAARLDEQRRAVALVRNAAESVDAPHDLRARVGVQPRRSRAVTAGRRRLVWAGGLAAAAAAALVLVLTLPEGAGGPSIAEAAVVATRSPAAPPP